MLCWDVRNGAHGLPEVCFFFGQKLFFPFFPPPAVDRSLLRGEAATTQLQCGDHLTSGLRNLLVLLILTSESPLQVYAGGK